MKPAPLLTFQANILRFLRYQNTTKRTYSCELEWDPVACRWGNSVWDDKQDTRVWSRAIPRALRTWRCMSNPKRRIKKSWWPPHFSPAHQTHPLPASSRNKQQKVGNPQNSVRRNKLLFEDGRTLCRWTLRKNYNVRNPSLPILTGAL